MIRDFRQKFGGFWLIPCSLLIALYVFASLNGIGNLIGMRRIAASLNTSISPAGWLLLVLGVLLPAIIFAAALTLKSKLAGRGLASLTLLLAAGIALFSCLQIELLYLVPQGLYLNPLES